METRKKLKFKKTGWGFIKIISFFLLTLCFSGIVYSKNNYQSYIASRYPGSSLANDCTVCHAGNPSKNNVNPYGNAWKAAGGNLTAVATIENQDSDGDSFTNLEEFQAGTYPGNSTSYPTPHVNQPPVANAGVNQTVNAGTVVTLNGSGSTDPDDGIASYSWSQTAGSTVTLSNSTSISSTFTASTAGSFTFTLTVTDFAGATSTDSCIITVNPVNIAPAANAGVDQTVAEGALVTLNGTNSSDPDNGIVSYLWTQASGTTVTLSDPTSVIPTFTAPSAGVLTFNLQVTDAGGLTGNDTCIVNVVWINQPPISNAGPDQLVSEGDLVTLNGSNSSDPDDGIVSYLWTQTAGTTVTLSDPTAVNPSFTAGTAGSLSFNLLVTDAGGLQANDVCIVNVTAGNQPPTADAGVDQTVDPGALVALNGTNSSDPDDGIASYLWTQTAGMTVTLSSSSSVNPTFTAPSTGPLTFILTVTDAGGLQSNDTCIVNIVIPANNPPVANAGPDQTVYEGETVVLDGTGSSDPDLDTITYLWTQTAGTSITLSDPAAANPYFTAALEGALTFRLTVTDSGGLQHSDLCIVNVVHINEPPVADAGANQSVVEGTTVQLNALASTDPDDGIDTFLWNQISGPPVTLSDSTDYVATFVAPPVNGTDIALTFELTVTDFGGLQSTALVNINVTDNGITMFPDNVISMMSNSDMPIGITVDSGGACTSLTTVDPLTLPADPQKPDDLIYGLINFRIKVAHPGDSAVISIYLSAPAPEDYSWYKYNNSTGWIDFSEHAVFNADRSQVTISITDGGPGDDDQMANGEIVDPSGLGIISTTSPVSSGGGDFGSGGGCFITTVNHENSSGSDMGILKSFKEFIILKYQLVKAHL